jgi:hypothetical protein
VDIETEQSYPFSSSVYDEGVSWYASLHREVTCVLSSCSNANIVTVDLFMSFFLLPELTNEVSMEGSI